MAELHFLNVRAGDAILIRHASDRLSMFDICCGNYAIPREEPRQLVEAVAKAKGNFRMCERPTNPIDYLIENFAGKRVWRFVLTHPDMDHLDGFNALMDRIGIDNFWDSGVRKEKPDFEGSGYLEEDWDRYVRVRDGHEPGVNVLSPLAGATFKYANEDDEGKAGDALTICSPDRVLVDEANANGDTNDASYVVRYYSAGGKIIIPGDAHDKTWNFVLSRFAAEVQNCSVLIAPHHGRKSGRSYEFLDVLRPKLTLFGCAPSEHLAYDAWSRRGLRFITKNQAGNVVLATFEGFIEVYVQNEKFAVAAGVDPQRRNRQGYFYLCTVHE